MKVRELIALLQAHDPEMNVMVDGYEGGVSDIGSSSVNPVKVMINYNQGSWYYGLHELVEDYKEWDGPTKTGLLISR